MSDGSVSIWIDDLKNGDELAAQKLWERYWESLVRMARGKLGGAPRRVADEEDVALSAFNSFCAGVAKRRFPTLEDRENLWPLLLTIVERKAWRQIGHEQRQKRGGGQTRGESVLHGADSSNAAGGIDRMPGREPTPEFAAEVAEGLQQLLDSLDDDLLRQVATLKMEGYTVDEIGQRAKLSTRTVKRKLGLIRSIWSQEEDQEAT